MKLLKLNILAILLLASFSAHAEYYFVYPEPIVGENDEMGYRTGCNDDFNRFEYGTPSGRGHDVPTHTRQDEYSFDLSTGDDNANIHPDMNIDF